MDGMSGIGYWVNIGRGGRRLAVAGVAAFAILTADAHRLNAQQSLPCDGDPGFSCLDFWVGEWTVWSGTEQVGTNRIVKVQDGCAIEEHWQGAGGGTGQSQAGPGRPRSMRNTGPSLREVRRRRLTPHQTRCPAGSGPAIETGMTVPM